MFRPLFLNVQASIPVFQVFIYECSGLYFWLFRSLFMNFKVFIPECSDLYFSYCLGLYSWLFWSLFLNIQSSVPVCLSPLFLIVEWMFRSLSDWELSPLLFRSLLLNFQVSIPECLGLYPGHAAWWRVGWCGLYSLLVYPAISTFPLQPGTAFFHSQIKYSRINISNKYSVPYMQKYGSFRKVCFLLV